MIAGKSGLLKIVILVIFCSALCSMNSCATKKEGCGLEEKYAPDMNSKGGKSSLFSKKMSKRMRG
jgi:hypothetical protein